MLPNALISMVFCYKNKSSSAMSKVENDVKKHVGQNRLCIINIMTVLEFKKRGENNFILILLLCHDSVVTIISLSYGLSYLRHFLPASWGIFLRAVYPTAG